MQVEELVNEGLKREFKVVVEAGELDAKLDTILSEFRATAQIKGFRPGKAPLSLLKRMHGERAMSQVLSETMQETSSRLMEDKGLKPAVRPEVDVDNYEDGQDLAYTIRLEVLPDIDISDFKAPALERWVADVADADIDTAAERVASQQKTFKKAAKTAKAKEGDALLIDYVGTVDGEAFEGGSAEDYQLELGSGTFIPGFEDQLTGAKADEDRTVTVTFPEQYHAETLAGKEAEFAVKVKEVRRQAEAALDDDLAKGLGFDDLAALKEALKEQLANDNQSLTRGLLKRRLLDSLAEAYDFAVPAKMVDLEFAQIWEQIKRDAIMSGDAKAEDFEGKDAPDDADEAAEFRAIAERRVRLGLLLSEIGVANDVQVSQDEINRRMVEEARRFPGQEAQIFQYFQENEDARAQLRAPIFEEKVVDFILEMADLTDKTVTREDLEAAVRALDEEEANPGKSEKSAPAKKAAAKKPAAKKADTAGKKPAAKKAPARKTPAKTAAARKPAAKKAAASKAKTDKTDTDGDT